MNTNINLIRKHGDLYDLIVRNNNIIELYHVDTPEGGRLTFYLYNPNENRISEIEPEVPKADFVHFHVSYRPCRDIYYAVVHTLADSTVDIDILAYDLEEKESRFLCSFNESPAVLTGRKRVRVFVLSRTQLLIQTEVEDFKAASSIMGTILFSQALYDVETGTATEVVEENFVNNGINSIIPLNDTEVMIKTGFSFLEDTRLSYGSEKEALIESVYVTTLSKLTADLALKLTNIDMQLLSSTYFDQYILKPEVKEDFILYNIVNVDQKESSCVFYNYVTREKMVGVNTDIDPSDMRLAYIIGNTPYVRRYIDNSCEFVNLQTAENDISFYDEDFVEVCGNLFLTYRRHGRRSRLRIYQYPHMDVLLEERCHYVAGILHDNNYYLYIE